MSTLEAYTSEQLPCGAAVGRSPHLTVIVFHPDLTAPERDMFAHELLTGQELKQWPSPSGR